MALTRYKRTLRTGGTSNALDGIDGANLVDGDMAEVWQSDNVLRFYHLDADSGRLVCAQG